MNLNAIKQCNTCCISKPIDKFRIRKNSKDGHSNKCVECSILWERQYYAKNSKKICNYTSNWSKKNRTTVTAKQKLYRKENSDKYRDSIYKSKYGITLNDYNKMLEIQENKCSICNKISDTLLYVDHCHKTKIVRGLLCNSCNKALGLFYDSLDTIRSAVKYLEKF